MSINSAKKDFIGNNSLMNEKNIQVAVAKLLWKGNICIPNLTLGNISEPKDNYCVYYEADLVLITGSDYLTEVEVKISIQDFRSDFTKKYYHSCIYTRLLYYAIPEDLYAKYHNEIEFAISSVKAGLITVQNKAGKLYAHIQKNAPVFNNSAKKLPFELKFRYMRTGCMKWFNRNFTDI